MNSIAHIVHALISHQPQPTADLSSTEQAALRELQPLLQAAPQDLSGMTPEARGWTLGATEDDRSIV
jgi:hypothetical protein